MTARHIIFYGSYDIIDSGVRFTATKKANPSNISYETNFRNTYFDIDGPRKAAYKTSANAILCSFRKVKPKDIKGGEKVHKYRRRKI